MRTVRFFLRSMRTNESALSTGGVAFKLTLLSGSSKGLPETEEALHST